MSIAVAVQEDMSPDERAVLIQAAEEQAYITETKTGLLFAEDTPIAVWARVTTRLIRQHKRIEWAIGDAINFGERKYRGTYDQWVNQTGLSENTLATIAWVSREIESSRRREDVGWSHHREVAALQPEDQVALLDLAADKGMTRHDLREKVKEVKRERAVEQALSQPAPSPLRVPPSVRLEQGDARKMPVTTGSVHLVCTSPPYGVGIDEYRDGGDILASDWPGFMLEWLTEAFRATVENGRLALNVPLDTTVGGNRPTYAYAVQMAEAAGWEYRSTILWIDDHLGKSTARGSMDSAAAPSIIAGAEMVALFSKGDWKRETPCKSDLERDEWVDWTNGVWRLSGESQAWEGHPAPFPYALPHRLIKLLSFPGDVVLDPFSGSGTTALAAANLHREFVGFDRSQAYVDSALRRVVQKGQAA